MALPICRFGNDTLYGGAGTDTAYYYSARADYAITYNQDGSVTVGDLRVVPALYQNGESGAYFDGTDTLQGIEKLRFSDADVLLPTYAIGSVPTSVMEGATVTFTVTTANVPPGTLLAYALGGTGITAADVVGGQLAGTSDRKSTRLNSSH